MKHVNMKNKILEAMMFSNPNNYWISEDKIVNDIGWFLRSDEIIPKICEELIQDGILQTDVVKAVTYDDYDISYNHTLIMYKITKEYIENLEM